MGFDVHSSTRSLIHPSLTLSLSLILHNRSPVSSQTHKRLQLFLLLVDLKRKASRKVRACVSGHRWIHMRTCAYAHVHTHHVKYISQSCGSPEAYASTRSRDKSPSHKLNVRASVCVVHFTTHPIKQKSLRHAFALLVSHVALPNQQ